MVGVSAEMEQNHSLLPDYKSELILGNELSAVA